MRKVEKKIFDLVYYFLILIELFALQGVLLLMCIGVGSSKFRAFWTGGIKKRVLFFFFFCLWFEEKFRELCLRILYTTNKNFFFVVL